MKTIKSSKYNRNFLSRILFLEIQVEIEKNKVKIFVRKQKLIEFLFRMMMGGSVIASVKKK